jgi:PncC family amidohydrolase
MRLIEKHGQVSEPVAAAMVEGVFQHSDADIAVAITGIAGPSGGSPDKPVGMVCFGLGKRGEAVQTHTSIFRQADRQGVRQKSSLLSIEALTDLLKLAY